MAFLLNPESNQNLIRFMRCRYPAKAQLLTMKRAHVLTVVLWLASCTLIVYTIIKEVGNVLHSLHLQIILYIRKLLFYLKTHGDAGIRCNNNIQ